MNEIRKSFLDFFKNNNHEIYNSASLIPYQDNTLLFVNAGMVPFKDFFLKKRKAEHINVATAQKCIRAGGKHNDLENVGFTKRHHTFFEMLGNFSFGDYFKEMAIYLAWQFLTVELGLNKAKLYITIYHDDEEAYLIWKKISGFHDDKIIRISTNDNFWQMGDTGPCGPCSEIFYDHGEHLFGFLPDKGDTGERFVEIWNLVFMQFNKDSYGNMNLLPEKCIDTGMGLERITAVIEGTDDNYETEIFRSIIKNTKDIVQNNLHQYAYKIIADHLRSSSFLIADGIVPGNNGRGYVLRRIIRRAVRYIYMLGYNKSLLKNLFPILKNYMGEFYPELIRAEESIISVLDCEECTFRSTLSKGVDMLNDFATKITDNVLSGTKAFMLYDTYGFPLEITKEILAEKNIFVDENEFELCMKEQRERARKSWLGSGEIAIDEQLFVIYDNYGTTDFVGYKEYKIECNIIGIINSNEKIFIVLNKTPFYAESGGQESDKGKIYNLCLQIDVIYVKKLFHDLHLHECVIKKGFPQIGDSVFAEIDFDRRNSIMVAHSATHVLHHALRIFLGKQVAQKGSLVSEDRLRFDFNYSKPLTVDELVNIEKFINTFIWKNFSVVTNIKKIDEAFNDGAIGLFGEKYTSDVRVVTIGDSKELCCGTHVANSADIGFFKIVSEGSIASGIRRIEALTRIKALDFIHYKNAEFQNIISQLNNKIVDEQKKSENTSYLYNKKIANLTEKSEEKIFDITYFTQILNDVSVEHARRIIVEYRDSIIFGVIAIVSIFNNKATLIISVTNNLVQNIDSVELIKIASSFMGMKGGGGKSEIAQCSCNIDNIHSIFNIIKSAISDKLSKLHV